MRRIITGLAAALATFAPLAACDSNDPGPSQATRFADVQTHSRVLQPLPADKIIVVVVENKGYTQMLASAPWIKSQALKYGYATNMKAITHPSQPNYTAMVEGRLGVTSNSYKQLSQPSILGNTWKAGRTAKVIADGMGTDRCRQTNGGTKYVFRHNPWVPYKTERALCEKYNFDLKYLAGDVAAARLPNVGFLIPNNCNNAHDCSIRTADNWIKAKVELLQSGPDWQAGRLAIVITADEDNKKEDNRILTVVIHPSQSGNVVTTPLTLYGLHRTLARFGHTPPLNNGKTATDLATAFGLPVS